jgi:hypothetical protein
MSDGEAEALVQAVEGLLAEKEAVAAKGAELIRSLNGVVNRMGTRGPPPASWTLGPRTAAA